jgi:hypothetical protein
MDIKIKVDVAKCGSYSLTGAIVKELLHRNISSSEWKDIHYIVEVSCSEIPKSSMLSAFLKNVLGVSDKFSNIEFVEGK